MILCVRIFVDTVVNEAELLFLWRKLELFKEVLGILNNRAFFCKFSAFWLLSLFNAFFVLRELGKNKHSIFEKFRAKHLAENLDGGLKLLI